MRKGAFLCGLAVNGRKNINFFHYHEQFAIFHANASIFTVLPAYVTFAAVAAAVYKCLNSLTPTAHDMMEEKSKTRVNKIIKLKINFIYINYVIIQHTHNMSLFAVLLSFLANQLCSFKMQIFSSFSLIHKRVLFFIILI